MSDDLMGDLERELTTRIAAVKAGRVVTGPAGVPPIITAQLRRNPNRCDCQWYAGCFNRSVGTVRHATLGDVPICQRCADKHDLTPIPNGS